MSPALKVSLSLGKQPFYKMHRPFLAAGACVCCSLRRRGTEKGKQIVNNRPFLTFILAVYEVLLYTIVVFWEFGAFSLPKR